MASLSTYRSSWQVLLSYDNLFQDGALKHVSVMLLEVAHKSEMPEIDSALFVPS